ncbi:hypothetical protein SAMN05444362_11213 [Dysgonomonas macrotermitis]|uniref:Uncharacterized protein n=1 Tax=Dysgonomonas macrotermitis TaxID=1346286 RepID=A0A1M5FJ16_9BACT|nr:hypothetical protein SAMN05444362_11213 [Dysgonomonas macrotermitis]
MEIIYNKHISTRIYIYTIYTNKTSNQSSPQNTKYIHI